MRQIRFYSISGFSQPSSVMDGFTGDLLSHFKDSELISYSPEELAESKAKTGCSYAEVIEPDLAKGYKNILLGWSLGGTVCCELASRNSNMIAGMILFSSTECFVQKENNPAGVPMVELEGLIGRIGANKEAALGAFIPLMTRDPLLRSKLLENSLSVGTKSLLDNLEYLKTDVRQQCLPCQVPRLLIHARKDRVIACANRPKLSRGVERIVAGISHLPFIEDRAICVDNSLEFLRSI